MGLFDAFKTGKDTPTPPKTNTVLVVDDDLYLREFYEDLLTRQGYLVKTATNGQEALTSINATRPDVILLDIMMPIMDGKEVLKQISENEQTNKIPVIVLTNAGSIENMDQAKFFSAYKFFVKSNVAPEELVKAVKDAIDLGTTPKLISQTSQ